MSHPPTQRTFGLITGHFVESFEPVLDGAARTAQSYREYEERELGPSWIVAPSDAAAPAVEPRVLRYGSSFAAPHRIGLALDPRVRAQLGRISWDLVHAHSPFTAGQWAADAARQNDAPLVLSLHTRYAEWARAKYRVSPRWASVVSVHARLQTDSSERLHSIDLIRATRHGEEYVTRAVMRRVWAYAAASSCVIVATAAERAELLSFAGSARDARTPRVEVVAPGIRPLEAASRFDVRARHALPEVPLLLFAGQLAEESGLGFLLQALAERRARQFPYRLLVVGDGSRRAHFERLARRLGVAERCVFVGRVESDAEMAAYYRAASLLVLPSAFEGRASAVLEAASVGLCSLGLRGAAGLTEVIHDGIDGFLADPSVAAYAIRIAELLRNTALRTGAGERARNGVRTHTAAAAEVVDLYGDVRRASAERSSRTYQLHPVPLGAASDAKASA